MYKDIEVLLAALFIIPGFIAFLGGGLKNGTNIKLSSIMEKTIELRNSMAEFLIFQIEGTEDGV